MDKAAASAAVKEQEKDKQKFLAKEREKQLAREVSQFRSLTMKDITIKGKQVLTYTCCHCSNVALPFVSFFGM